MANYTLRITDQNGDVLQESNLELAEGSTLICSIDSKVITSEMSKRICEHISECLKNKKPVIVVPEFVKFSVLEFK